MRGSRSIPSTFAGKKLTTSDRIKALLKYLFSHDGERLVDDKKIKDAYDDLKKLACRERNDAIEANPLIRPMSWKQLQGYNPSLHEQITLNLESRAFLLYKVKLHLCQGSWASDRLMFEAFRGGSKGKKSGIS